MKIDFKTIILIWKERKGMSDLLPNNICLVRLFKKNSGLSISPPKKVKHETAIYYVHSTLCQLGYYMKMILKNSYFNHFSTYLLTYTANVLSLENADVCLHSKSNNNHVLNL